MEKKSKTIIDMGKNYNREEVKPIPALTEKWFMESHITRLAILYGCSEEYIKKNLKIE